MKKLICVFIFTLLLTGCIHQTIEQRIETAEFCEDFDLEIVYNTSDVGQHWVSCK
jgi:hypothetical protein